MMYTLLSNIQAIPYLCRLLLLCFLCFVLVDDYFVKVVVDTNFPLTIAPCHSRNVIYRRELAAFSYSAAPYWLSQCLVILPVLLWNQLLFMLITYW